MCAKPFPPLSALFNFCFMPVVSIASEHRFDIVSFGQGDYCSIIYIVDTHIDEA